jgi:hypothetical protein
MCGPYCPYYIFPIDLVTHDLTVSSPSVAPELMRTTGQLSRPRTTIRLLLLVVPLSVADLYHADLAMAPSAAIQDLRRLPPPTHHRRLPRHPRHLRH